MKLVSLNCWAGKIYEPLMEFVKEHAETTDVFCFQEVNDNPDGVIHDGEYRANLFNELRATLPDFTALYAASFDRVVNAHTRVKYPLALGLAMYVRSPHRVMLHREVVVSVSPPLPHIPSFAAYGMPRNMQLVTLATEVGTLSVANFHGLWIPNYGKADAPERIAQSRSINAVLDETPLPHIIAGDFNLNPDTKSLDILEKGRKNLIKEYGITDTRTKYYEKPSRFADYAFVSTGVSVNSFEVPDVPVSDHRPMILDFET